MDWTKLSLDHLTAMLRSFVGSLPADWRTVEGIWPAVVLLVAAVIIGLYGERLTRVLILGIFIFLGAAAGQQVAAWLDLPFWPTVIFVGSLSGIFAYVLYRYALGLVLAVALSLSCGAWSLASNFDKQEISDLAASLSAPQQSPVEHADAAVPTELSFYVQRLHGLVQRVQDLRQSIADKPAAQKHLVIMLLAGAAAGMLAGLVLGRVAAMLWTSLLGGVGVVMALASLAVHVQQGWGDWLSDNRQYVVGAAGAVALLFMVRQATRRAGGAAPASEVAASSDKS